MKDITDMEKDRQYMKMALELAQKGMGFTAPNPMVGAVIVKSGKVIGQGYHRKYGELHAEREALAACTEEPEGASIYVFHADTEGLNFRKAFKDAGYKLAECLIWKKDCFVMGRQDYQWQHEPILYGWKEGAAHHFINDRTQSTILEFDRPRQSSLHPTMKPIDLVARLLKNSSKENDKILDLFGGSGSTIIAAEQLNRNCYTMELDPKYCDVIVKRWESLTNKEAILERR